jgi:molecular chaperone GrpE
MKKHEDTKVTKEENLVSEEESLEDDSEIKNLENQLKRALADYQNLEKRIAGEKMDWIKLANKDLLLKLLPGLDNLMLAEKHTKDEGVKITIKHFLDIFTEIGVKKIETVGKEFDPNTMEAVATVEGKENQVLEEVRSGYALFDTILRPAQVVVGQPVGRQVESS